MNSLESTVLGLIQGFTEFLPISSSAHLVLTPYFFKWDDPGLAYDVALHMGTLAALLLAFRKDWIAILHQCLGFLKGKGLHEETGSETPSILKIIAGTIPAALLGLMFEKQAEEAFRSPILIAVTLSLFAALLWYFDTKGSKSKDLRSITYQSAMIIGIAQAIAIIPGVSRSGITITAALMLGFRRDSAMRFSFLLSAPIIAGAGLVKFKHILALIHSSSDYAMYVGIGFLASLISGLIAIQILNAIVKSRTFMSFVYYRFALSFIIIAIIVLR